MSTTETQIQTLKDPKKWFEYYKQQKFVGDILLEKAMSKEELIKIKNGGGDSNYVTLFINATYHWGIAIENGLKAIFVKRFPEKIQYQENDGYLKISSVGGTAGKTHNLLKLAEEIGVFDQKDKLFKYADDYKTLKQVLLHISDVIKWAARYPISHNTATVYKIGKDVPLVAVYGFHVLDYIKPLFSLFEREMENEH